MKKQRQWRRVEALICAMFLLLGSALSVQVSATEPYRLDGKLQFYRLSPKGEWLETDQSIMDMAEDRTIRLTLPTNQEEAAMMILATYDKYNYLTDIVSDQKLSEEAPRTLTVTASTSADETMHLFTFNGLEDLKPMRPDTTNTEALVSYADSHSIILNWPDELFPNADSYQVSRDGVVLGDTETERFIDICLENDTIYAYTITPITAGVGGKSLSFTAKTKDMGAAVLGEGGNEKGLTLYRNTDDGSDSYTEESVVGGRTCRIMPNIPIASPKLNRYGMCYFRVDNQIVPEDVGNVTFEITYFDHGTEKRNSDGSSNGEIQSVVLDYVTSEGTSGYVKLATPQNTDTWKTIRISVSDAQFMKGMNNNNDFRIRGPVAISRVSVGQTEYFSDMPAYIRGANVQYPETAKISKMEASGNELKVWLENDALPAGEKKVLTIHRDGVAENLTTVTYCTASGTNTVTATGGQRQTLMLDEMVLSQDDQGKPDIVIATDADDAAVSGISLGTVMSQTLKFSIDQETGEELEEGLSHKYKRNDGTTSTGEIGGSKFLLAGPIEGKRQTYIYMKADPRYMHGFKDPMMTLEFEYYDDEGGNQITIQYNSDVPKGDGFDSFRSIPIVTKEGSGTWKTASVTLCNVCLLGKQNDGADFRLGSATSSLYVRRIKIKAEKTIDPRKKPSVKIFLAGDSTCEPLPNNYAPREGWGMEIGNYFKDTVSINNQAKGGKSSRTFLNDVDASLNPVLENDGRMKAILSGAQPGDYLFIQFGHNETTTRPQQWTDPDSEEENDTSYRYNLRQFVKICREYEVQPVFLTSLWVRKFSGTQLEDTGIEAYRNAMREVGEELDVPVIDVGAAHKSLVESWGVKGSKDLFCNFTKDQYPSYPTNLPDNTHISQTGAIEVCKIIAREIQNGAVTDLRLAELAGLLNPNADLTPGEPSNYES